MVEVHTLIKPHREPTAKEMAPYVAQGAHFRDPHLGYDYGVKPVLTLDTSEYWEYEIAGVFVRTQMWPEIPDSWEEERG